MTNNDTTIGDFADAAKNASWENDRHLDDTGEWSRMKFMRGAEWAQRYLAAQEPTDAEVEAADRGRVEHNIRRRLTDAEWSGMRSAAEHEAMRAALSAARKA